MVWFVRRVGISLMLLLVVTSLVFMSIRMVPGDPVELLLSSEGNAPDPESVAAMRERLGLDRPIYEQYADTMLRFVRFDFGKSLISGSPIGRDIALRFPRTLELVALGSLVSLLIGVPAGVAAALRRGGIFDRVAFAITAFVQSIPVFVKGTIFVLVFSQILRLVPAGGYVEFSNDPIRHLMLVLMPSLTIGIGFAGTLFRITRASTLEVIPLDYVRTARAKGVTQQRIIVRHILRNSLMPVITVFALHVGSLLSGTVLTEAVFNYPGLSGMLVTAVNSRDYPAVTAILAVTSASFILINLVVDMLYGLLDPRVRR
ncbi:ABC transporter permease [Bradyrhizobium sp. BWA-3-5]|uniref:ABC transporter permease n=1 Tax=Bradyrhizobium sp. BWA-3-5 TaxID=3080013 RepID=UPI00293F678A|nr:ABC transporter permease [Bradyrhizobium sp. BWA-3-5]WOH63733.1 ABC transporter permease [Bradyrhizobium sp. BWA-3-5]